MTTNRSVYQNQQANNDPAFMFYLACDNIAHNYEKKVYDLFNFFGIVGGFIEVFQILSSLLVSLLCTNLIEAKTVMVFLNETFGFCHEHDKLALLSFGF